MRHDYIRRVVPGREDRVRSGYDSYDSGHSRPQARSTALLQLCQIPNCAGNSTLPNRSNYCKSPIKRRRVRLISAERGAGFRNAALPASEGLRASEDLISGSTVSAGYPLAAAALPRLRPPKLRVQSLPRIFLSPGPPRPRAQRFRFVAPRAPKVIALRPTHPRPRNELTRSSAPAMSTNMSIFMCAVMKSAA